MALPVQWILRVLEGRGSYPLGDFMRKISLRAASRSPNVSKHTPYSDSCQSNVCQEKHLPGANNTTSISEQKYKLVIFLVITLTIIWMIAPFQFPIDPSDTISKKSERETNRPQSNILTSEKEPKFSNSND